MLKSKWIILGVVLGAPVVLLVMIGFVSTRFSSAMDWQGCPGITAFAFMPDDRRLVVATTTGELRWFDRKGAFLTPMVGAAGVDYASPAVSSDGRWLVYSARAQASDSTRHLFVWELSPEGRVARQITSGDIDDDKPTFSPDGKWIVFLRKVPYDQLLGGDHYTLYAVGRNGTGLRRLTSRVYDDRTTPRFWQNGGAIIYANDDITDERWGQEVRKSGLFSIPWGADAVPVDTTAVVSKQIVAAEVREFDIRSGGAEIVFVADSSHPYSREICRLDLRTGRIFWLRTESASQDVADPVFAPDGKEVFFLAQTGEAQEGTNLYYLWSVDAGGKGRLREVISAQMLGRSYRPLPPPM